MPRKPRATPSVAAKVPSSSTPTPSPSPANGLLFPDSSAFTTWLSNNHASTPQGTWLLISKKGTKVNPTLTYDEALDAALCYGWIDGQRKSQPQNGGSHFAQRFTPRRKGSTWSKRNVDKVVALRAEGRMCEPGEREVQAAMEDGRWERAYVGAKDMEVPKDLEVALKERGGKKERECFEGLSKAQRYPYLVRIETATTDEARKKRIEQFVDLLASGKIG